MGATKPGKKGRNKKMMVDRPRPRAVVCYVFPPPPLSEGSLPSDPSLLRVTGYFPWIQAGSG